MQKFHVVDEEVTEEQNTTDVVEETSVLSEKIEDLEDEVNETNKELEELQSIDSKLENEDVVVQEKNWLEERAREQRKAEDTYREELFEKQKLLEQKRREMSESFAQNKQMKVYNQMHDEEQNDLIYELHGVSVDMIDGMREYKNALFQGAILILLLTGMVICAYMGFLYGMRSELFHACIALFACNIALLPRESFGKIQGGLYNGICKFLCVLPTPVMASLIFIKSTYPTIYVYAMEWFGVAVGVICLIGALGYCLRNPYRSMRHAVRAANADIKDLKKTASKTVKKNKKTRAKLESKLLKKKEKQEDKLERLKLKEQGRIDKLKKKEEEKSRKLAARLQIENEKKERAEELAEARRVNREKYKELYGQKVSNFKMKFMRNKSTSIVENNETESEDKKAM